MLLLETNLMMDLTLHKWIPLPIITEFKHNTTIKIPRLCILKMERIAHDLTAASDEKRVNKRKRNVILAWSEYSFSNNREPDFYLN